MTWTHVKGAIQTSGSGTSANVSFASSVTSGDIVVGMAFLNGSSTGAVSSITDDKSNTYTVINSQGVISGSGSWVTVTFWSAAKLTNTPTTITVNANFSTTNLWILVDEFTPPSGTLSTDGGSTGSQTGASNNDPDAGAFTTTANGDLVYGATFSVTGTQSAGTGFTLGQSASDFASEYLNQTSAGSVDVFFTPVSGAWTCNAFALKAVAAANVSQLIKEINQSLKRASYW